MFICLFVYSFTYESLESLSYLIAFDNPWQVIGNPAEQEGILVEYAL